MKTTPSLPGSGLSGLLGYFVSHRTAANLLLLMILVIGIASATRLRAQFFPDVPVNTITVSVVWSGAAPKDMDQAIVSRIEPRLRAIDGVKTATAVSRQSAATITLEFQPGTDIAAAMDEAKMAIDEIRDLPADIEKPVLQPGRWRDRVTDVLISGELNVEPLYRIAEEFKTALFAKGVTLTTIDGISAPEIRIDVRPHDLEKFKVSLSDISTAIRSETGTQPIGRIESTGARVRAQTRDLTPEAIAAIPIRARADGSKILLADVANVTEEGLDRSTALYHDGKPAVIVQVNRDAQGDALKVQSIVEDAVAEMSPRLTQGVSMKLVHPRASEISARLDILVRNGLSGLAVVIVLLFLFLSARTAFWVTAGIPVAMAATLALMYAFGFTFNMISLFALIICLGIVVDDAIVVGEHADHLARQGMLPDKAATEAASRMAAPVLSASITTVIAFAVLVLVTGQMGRFVSDIPFTVSVVILASLVESFLILPAHMRHALTHVGKRSLLDLPSEWVNRGFDRFKVSIFTPFMRHVVALRYPVLAGGLALLAISVAAFLDKTVRWQFFSSPERATIRANLAMLDSATRDDTKSMVSELDRALRAVDERYQEKYGRAPVQVAIAKIGGTTGRGLKGADVKDPDQLAGYDIELIDPDQRPYTAFEFLRDWQNEIKRHPLLEALALRGDRSGPGGDAIDVRIAGADETILKSAAEAVKAALARYPAATGIEDDLAYDRPELLIQLTPRGEALGFTTQTIAAALRQRLDGIEAIKLARETQEVIARVRLPEDDIGPAYLHQARVPLPDGSGFVALSDIASVTEVEGFSSIRRENGNRRVSITGDLSDDPTTSAEVISALRNDILPDVAARYGVTWTLGGLAEQESEFLGEAAFGFILSLIGIYLVLAWVFASWSRPAIVMLIIPFGLIGTIWGHWLHGAPLTMFSVVGLIGMAGIIINDSIVLVTTIDERAKSSDILTAIVDGTADRLRAVMLTTATTVGGLAPLLLETSRQAQFLKPTVITLSYGLGFGVIMVLLLTPSMMGVHHDIARYIRSMRRLPRVLLRRRAMLNPARSSVV